MTSTVYDLTDRMARKELERRHDLATDDLARMAQSYREIIAERREREGQQLEAAARSLRIWSE